MTVCCEMQPPSGRCVTSQAGSGSGAVMTDLSAVCRQRANAAFLLTPLFSHRAQLHENQLVYPAATHLKHAVT